MIKIPAIRFHDRKPVHAPWPWVLGPYPERAVVCETHVDADLAGADLALEFGQRNIEGRLRFLDAGDQGWLLALMPADCPPEGGQKGPAVSRAWAAEPGITTTPLPRMQVRWRQSRWEAYCPCCERVVGYSGDRQRTTREGVEHATCRCPQRLAARGLCPCRSCGGWGCVDLGDGHLDRCDDCRGTCTQSLH